MDLCNLFDRSFFQNLITTFIGASLAIPTAMFVDRRIRQRQEKVERSQLIDALKHALQKNQDQLGSLEQDLKQVAPSSVALNLMDLTLLNATAAKKYETLDSVFVCKAVDYARYQMQLINHTLDYIRRIDANNPGRIPPSRHIVESCKNQISNARKAIEEAIARLENG